MCERCLPGDVTARPPAAAGRMGRRRALGVLATGTIALATGRMPRVDAGAPPAVQPRSAWAGADRQPLAPMGAEDVRFLLVHHTASANGAEPISVMRSAYDFHTGPDKGWPDVAYNFFIDQFGTVYEARAGSLAGPVEASATGGSQGFAQLVCLLGDFTSVLPTEAALRSLGQTLAWLADRYGIDTAPGAMATFTSRGSNKWPAGTEITTPTIAGHRDMSATACPGDTFYPYLTSVVRDDVHRLLLASAPATTSTPPTTATSTPATTAPPPSSAATVPPMTAAEAPDAATAATTAITATTTTTQPPTSTSTSSPTAVTGAQLSQLGTDPPDPAGADTDAAAAAALGTAPAVAGAASPADPDGGGAPAAWPWFALGGLVAAGAAASWYTTRRQPPSEGGHDAL